jgi:hypothetical protein
MWKWWNGISKIYSGIGMYCNLKKLENLHSPSARSNPKLPDLEIGALGTLNGHRDARREKWIEIE